MVPVNFSVSSQGNATGLEEVQDYSSTRKRSRKIRTGEEDICQNIFRVKRICHHSDFFIS